MTRRDTTHDAAIRSLYAENLEPKEIAERLRISDARVKLALRRNGITIRPDRSRTIVSLETERRIVDLSKLGMTQPEISRETGVKYNLVVGVIKRNRLTPNRGSGRLTAAQVRELRIVAMCCRSWAKVGAMFGIDRRTAKSIGTGKGIAHLPMPNPRAFGLSDYSHKRVRQTIKKRHGDDAIAASYTVANRSLRQIAKKRGVSVGYVARALKRCGVELRTENWCRASARFAKVG